MSYYTAIRLKAAVEAAAGVPTEISVGQNGVKLTPETPAGRNAVNAFDWSAAAEQAWLEDQHPQRKALRQAAANAIEDNDTFLAIASPTNPQVVAQVRRLTQQMNRVIPRLIQLD